MSDRFSISPCMVVGKGGVYVDDWLGVALLRWKCMRCST